MHHCDNFLSLRNNLKFCGQCGVYYARLWIVLLFIYISINLSGIVVDLFSNGKVLPEMHEVLLHIIFTIQLCKYIMWIILTIFSLSCSPWVSSVTIIIKWVGCKVSLVAIIYRQFRHKFHNAYTSCVQCSWFEHISISCALAILDSVELG